MGRGRYVASLMLILASWFVLLHELITEGYVIDLKDFITPQVTHEKIFITLLLIGLALGVRGRGK